MILDKKKIDLIFIFLLVAVLLAFWLPTINIPYWWDSAGYVVHTARQFLETNFNPLVPRDEYTTFAHPPFFIATLAGLWKIFGESLLVSHLLNLIFAFLVLFYTYLLGKELIKDKILGNLIGFSSGILLLFTPVFLAQLGIIYVEIPAVAFAVMTVYYTLKKNLLGYLIAATLMVLTKEITVFIVFIVLAVIFSKEIFRWVKRKELNLANFFKKIFLWSIPLFILFLWFFYHKVVSGWWLVIPGREFGGGLEMSFERIWMVFKFLFFEQWRNILTFLIIFSGIGAFFREDIRKYFQNLKVFLIFLIPVITALFFGLTEFLHRYIIIALPFFYLLFFYCLALFFLKRPIKEQIWIFGAMTLILLLLFSFGWDEHRQIRDWHFPPLEENLEYLDVIAVGKEMAGFVEKYYPDAVVWTAFPSNYMLSEPFQHYVSKPIEVHSCRDYQEGDKVDLIVFHLLSPPQRDCLLMIRELKATLLIPFGKNGKWMQIYKNPNL